MKNGKGGPGLVREERLQIHAVPRGAENRR